MFGREMRMPIDIMYGSPPTQQGTRVQAIDQMKTVMEKSYELARIHLDASHKRQKDYYDRSTTGNRFKIGEKVLLYTPALKKNECPKFHKPWTGPWTISNQLSDVNFRIQNSKGKMKVVHFDRMKKFYEVPQQWKRRV